MSLCMCLVQAGRIDAEVEAALRRRLDAFTREVFGSPATITWTEIAEDHGFTAGAPSAASVVSVRAPAPLEQLRRVELLDALSALWMEETACGLDELVAVVADPPKQEAA